MTSFSRTHRSSRLVSLTMIALGLSACGANDDSESLVSDADVASSEAALSVAVLESAGTSASAEEAAAASGEAAIALFAPAGCVTQTTSGADVTYVFAGCTGPHGLVAVNGTLSVHYSVVPRGVRADISADDFQIGGASFDITTSATYVQGSASESLSITSQSTVVGSRGRSGARSSMLDVTWDAECISIDGSTSGSLGATTISDYRVCRGGCPTGIVAREGVRANQSVTFDGSANASWVTDNRSGTIALTCGGA